MLNINKLIPRNYLIYCLIFLIFNAYYISVLAAFKTLENGFNKRDNKIKPLLGNGYRRKYM